MLTRSLSTNKLHSSSSDDVNALLAVKTPILLNKGSSVLPICIGGLHGVPDYHQGEKFRLLLELILSHQAENTHVHIVITDSSDTLQILDETLSEAQAYRNSKKSGEDWVNQQQSILDLYHNKTIHWWYELLLQSNYIPLRKQFNDFYLTDIDFRNAIDVTVWDFVEKIKKYLNKPQYSDEELQRYFKLCKNYVESESVNIVQLQQKSGFKYIVYPGALSKAIHSTIVKFKLKDVIVVQPEFIAHTNTPTVQKYIPILGYKDDLIECILKQYEKLHAECSAERIKLLSECRIYLLPRSVPYIREKAATEIKLLVIEMQSKSNSKLKIIELNDKKNTFLIVAPEDNRYDDQFSNFESAKNYSVKQTIDFDILCSSFSSISNGVISLSNLYLQEEARLFSMVRETSDPKLQDVSKAIKFCYSCLVYKDIAPNASIIMVGEETQTKLYFTCSDGAVASSNEFQAITDYLLKLDSNLAIAFETIKIPNEIALQQAIHIVNPNDLLKLIFKSFISQRKESIDTQSSEEFRSPQPSPENKYRSLQHGAVSAEYTSPVVFRTVGSKPRGASVSSTSSLTSPLPSPLGSPELLPSFNTPPASPANNEKSSGRSNSRSPSRNSFFGHIPNPPPKLELPPRGAGAMEKPKNTQKNQPPG